MGIRRWGVDDCTILVRFQSSVKYFSSGALQLSLHELTCGARGPEKARNLSPAAPEQPYRGSGALLQDSWSIVTGLLEKVYGRGCEMLPPRSGQICGAQRVVRACVSGAGDAPLSNK